MLIFMRNAYLSYRIDIFIDLPNLPKPNLSSNIVQIDLAEIDIVQLGSVKEVQKAINKKNSQY